MIINPEILHNSNIKQLICQEFEKMDQKYQSLSLRFEGFGGTIFANDIEKQSFLYGVAAGYKELGVEGKDVGRAVKRMNVQDDIPIVDKFYQDEFKLFSEALENDTLVDEIGKKISKAAREDSEYYHRARRQIQSGLIPTPYYLGVSMIHDFVVNKTAKPSR